MSASNVAVGDEITVLLDNKFERGRIYHTQTDMFDVDTKFERSRGLRYATQRYWLVDEGQTWARGWDTEDARALEATVLLQRSAV